MIETLEAPVEIVTPIKPSEAIRLGCLIAPIQLLDGEYVDEPARAACAFGAMALGMGGGWEDAEDRARNLHVTIPTYPPCPVEGCGTYVTVVHLNDYHRWSRESIADLLEGLGL